jgi:hypothetical protein
VNETISNGIQEGSTRAGSSSLILIRTRPGSKHAVPEGLQERRLPDHRARSQGLVRWRVHPNAITTFGFAVTVAPGRSSTWTTCVGGASVILLGGVLDIFDGQVARKAGSHPSSGRSTIPRWTGSARSWSFSGLLSLYNQYGPDSGRRLDGLRDRPRDGGSLMVSYTRAGPRRSAGLLGGFMQRAERVVLLGGVPVLRPHVGRAGPQGRPDHSGGGHDLTSIQRIVWVYQKRGGRPAG